MTYISNSDNMAAKALQGFDKSYIAMSKAMERLSSGKRINSAGDDPSGLSIITKLQARSIGLKQGIKNTLKAKNIVNIAESGLKTIEDKLHNLRELSVQVQTDLNTGTDKSFIEKEAQDILLSIDRISNSTNFNNQKLLDGSFANKFIQVGADGNSTSHLNLSINEVNSKSLGISEVSFNDEKTFISYGMKSEEFQVNTFTSGNQGYFHEGHPGYGGPVIESLTSGGYVISWTSDGQDGSDLGVYGQIYDKNNLSVGSEFRINTYTTNKQTMVKLASYHDGKFIAVYSSEGNDGNMFGVFGQIFNANGTKNGSEFQINTSTSNSQYSPDISILDNGDALVTWASYHLHSSTGKEHEIFGQVIDSNGNTVGGEFQINTTVIGGQGQPSISKLSNGNLIVAWESAEVAHGNTFDVKAQILNSSGTKIGEEIILNSTTSNDQSEPKVKSLKNGGFVSVWQSKGQDGNGNGIYARIFNNNGTAITSEFKVNTNTINEQIIPRLTDTNDGGFTVTWSSNLQDGSDYGVFARKFNSKGESVTEEFQLNTSTSGLQKYADITALDNGDMISTWISDGQDGDGYGIFAQRFNWKPINLIDTAIKNLSKIMLPLGILENRLNSIINNITDVDLNLSKSISNINDANFTLETSKLVSNQILQKASTSMVTKATNVSKHLLQILNKE